MEQEENRSPEDPGQGPGSSEGSGGRDAAGDPAGDGAAEVIAAPAVSGSVKDPGADFLRRIPAVHVTLSVFDGPLDLLLELIKKNEMDIKDIQISVITQQYLASIEEMRELNLEVAGEYLVMAATLLYIKSKMLLPADETEEDEDGEDPREELVRKLLEYQAFKAAAQELGFLEDERGKVFTRQIADYYLSNLTPEDVGIDTFSANLYDLLSAFQNVVAKATKDTIHEVFEEVISIEERIADIRRRLIEEKQVRFSELFKNYRSKNILIATFLALLEIVRTRFARVVQSDAYGEIIIERQEDSPQAA